MSQPWDMPTFGDTMIRCSRLPLFALCPSSAKDAPEYNAPHDAAKIGNAVHDVARYLVQNGHVSAELKSTMAAKYGLDLGDDVETEDLIARMATMWDQISKEYPDASAEVPLEGSIVGGTADLISSTGWHLRILDWKTGRNRTDYSDQILGYAYAAREKYGMPKSQKIEAAIAWVRFNEIERFEFTSAQLDAFAERIRAQRQLIGKSYNPGPHCRYCPHQLGCTTRQAYVGDSITIATALALPDTTTMTPSVVAKLWPRLQLIEEAVRRAKELAKETVDLTGPVQLENGKRLQLETRHRNQMDTGRTVDYLAGAGYTQAEIRGVMSVGTEALKKLVCDKAPTGNKEKTWESVKKDLEHQKALTKHPFQVLTTR